MKQITEILRTEGIMSQGFGISPKILYRDKRLTPEAKAIYGYIASFAGNGNTAFPGRDIMLEELGMSAKRYYKHFNLLIDCGYISVTKQRDRFGSFDKNVYTLVSNPVAKEVEDTEEKLESVNGSGTAGKEKTALESEKSLLRLTMGIDEIIKQQPKDTRLIEKIYMAAKDMEESEEIKLGGNLKSRKNIEGILNMLTADSTRTVLFKYKEVRKNNNYKIHNTKAFLQTLICNSVFEDYADYCEAAGLEVRKEEQQRAKAEESKKQEESRRLREEVYRNQPVIQTLDKEYSDLMRKISKAILSDGPEKEELQLKKEQLVLQRESYIEAHHLPENF